MDGAPGFPAQGAGARFWRLNGHALGLARWPNFMIAIAVWLAGFRNCPV